MMSMDFCHMHGPEHHVIVGSALLTAYKNTGTDIDMSGQYSKLISDIPTPDIVITMGCNVQCPNIPCKERYDWGLDDPTGKSDEEFIETANKIKEKILELKII